MLINIQFLRFAAALLVVIYHANKHLLSTGADQGWLFAAGELAGFAGVDVFFVISGFIMFYTTEKARGVVHAADFLNRRISRIFSGYWPFFLLAAAVFAWARPEHFESARLLTSFFLWPMPLNEVLLDVSWTLSYELYFYFLFAVLILVGVRSRFWLLTGMVVLIAAVNGFRHFILHDFSPERFYLFGFMSHFLPSPFLMEFFAGALLAALPGKGSLRMGWLLLGVGVAGFAMAGAANALVYDGKIEQGYHVVPRVLLFGIPSLLILRGLVNLEHNGRVAPRRFSLHTGGASYAIYLCHTIFLVATMKLGLNTALKGWPDGLVQAIFMLYCALIVLYSVVHYRYIERPLHRWFRGLAPKLLKRD
jgi:peptidoglycan/LPS O-acetylase OafA/YrhL